MAVGLLGCVASPAFAKQPIWLLHGRVGVELRPASLIVNRGILRAALHFLHLVAPGLIVRARLSRPLFECQIFIIPELLANYLFQQRSELARLRHLARRDVVRGLLQHLLRQGPALLAKGGGAGDGARQPRVRVRQRLCK